MPIQHPAMRSFALAGLLWLAASGLEASAASTINWTSCASALTDPSNDSPAIQCADLQVPRDYTNVGAGNITLKLTKLVATSGPSKGSILYNPGGPGLSGRSQVAGYTGYEVSVVTGGQFDIISWDPRGTGETLPYSCFNSDTDRQVLEAKTPQHSNASDTALGQVWALRTVFADACAVNAHDYGDLVGTAFTARDMIQIVDGLGEDGLLRYWGISYGSILGMTVAAMFPDRVDRIVIDGVLNPKDYYAGLDVSQILSTDAAFAGFFKGCVASPALCPLAQLGKDANSISNQVWQLIDRLKYNPIAFGGNLTTEYFDYDVVKSLIFQGLYNPVQFWPALSIILHGLITNNATEAVSVYSQFVAVYPPTFPDRSGIEAIPGIRCSDVSLRTKDLASLTPLIQDFYRTSKIGGDYLPPAQPLICAQWPFQAKERVKTDWNVNTRKPVLFIGNTFDPITSLTSAKNASSGFKGSRLLTQNGYGHSSLAQPSRCTAKYIRAYFTNGTLPAAGTTCQIDVDLFTTETFPDVILSSPGNTTKRAVPQLSDDERLRVAKRGLDPQW
ncbi:hypothetical protein K461DRAFT_276837 [Myriangium duriaei CBS 260.36]|uniref:Peptidase S33 tripeptidyl aminopeptidase-like C-terminal domain-containing protein n=1 Tax=Myriangium duriaei CBS 260.36 TaxID=1168546 RepID=A0A9P4MNJ6_9PEZI|nr:hypothetical protein K461DRAFT_276837 [Myriangium duriaei CBS 260.36]